MSNFSSMPLSKSMAFTVSIDITAQMHHVEIFYIEEKKEPTDDTSKDVCSLWINSTCFGHHYAHCQETD